MRYRKLSASGDYTFGHGVSDFHIDTPEAVGQAVKTKLLLWREEWFLDTTEGTPYLTEILGKNQQGAYDLAIRERILDTTGVKEILSYLSELDRATRALVVTATIDTIYGQTSFTQVLV